MAVIKSKLKTTGAEFKAAVKGMRAQVDELNERLGLNIPETGQYVTLAGFLLAKSGRLLKESEEIPFEDCVFRVDQMIGRRIMRVRLTRIVRKTIENAG